MITLRGKLLALGVSVLALLPACCGQKKKKIVECPTCDLVSAQKETFVDRNIEPVVEITQTAPAEEEIEK